ncbi:hypothetical protein BJ166DRAFT_596132 [Pestalotiopsis sp. NC0098]|nr:hypothetical protein BJ166DRAFT_596132 [Pestalotiopsis sp. NC0098]
MAMNSEGAQMVAVLWSLTAIVLVFLVLRAYTRIVCVASYGIDDHFYVLTCVLLVAYSSIMQVAAEHGYGQDDLSPDAKTTANYWRTIGQSFSLVATGASKVSVGLFLLRLTVVRWQRIAVYTLVVFMMTTATLATIFTWAACRPFAYTWDDRIEGGTCLNTVPLSYILAMGTIGVDIFFAVLPWIFIWKLNAPRREKIVIAGSLSLGIFAAVAGAKRILDVKGVRDVPPGVIIWSMVETAVTLVCVGIPVCRPLLGQILKKISTSRGSKRSKSPSHDPNNGGPAPIGLHTFGGSPMQPGAAAGHRRRRDIVSDLFSRLAPSTGVFSRATVPTTTKSRAVGDDPTGDGQSEQAIMNHGADCCKDDVEAHGGHHSSSSRDLDVDEKDGHLARECTRSWIIGESINRNEVSSSGPEGEHKDDIIMTSKSYEVKRGESPV